MALNRLQVEYWATSRLKPYEKNPRKNSQVVNRMRASIREFDFAVPILAKSDGTVIDGDLRLKGDWQRIFQRSRSSSATAGLRSRSRRSGSW